ncbi:hypothetical protein CT0861_12822, partial [Colletotrichum tofieldiae]
LQQRQGLLLLCRVGRFPLPHKHPPLAFTTTTHSNGLLSFSWRFYSRAFLTFLLTCGMRLFETILFWAGIQEQEGGWETCAVCSMLNSIPDISISFKNYYFLPLIISLMS